MYMSNPKLNVRPLLAIMAVLLVAPLAGCVADDLTADDNIMPYGGSKTHPIKVANGKAYVENCGQWTEDLGDTASNAMSMNHGCAVQANIAAMTAYPNDLVKLRRMTPSPAYRGTAALTKLQTPSSSASSSSAASSAAPVSGGAAP